MLNTVSLVYEKIPLYESPHEDFCIWQLVDNDIYDVEYYQSGAEHATAKAISCGG